ncbi:helix-turn-helix domain-containing protein [Paraburkholderia saeva]|uniref:helix-turn-helix domain-containing protein n=1 Tax=Paraburkholderia saeva TaxID=2777537 RepID=UPI001DD99EF3|nr:helix-turn-helix domain-containing protein [Paraburkholderia saeva]CAG4890120.1 HTH-type transcriptional activator RhaR [Paraburkholderia saeva]
MMQIGRVEISLDRRELLVDGKSQVLGSRAFDILELLVAAHGQVVSRDEIFRTVWPNTVVEQNNIQVHISALRKALGESRDLIDTVPGRGYRLLRPDPDATEPAAAPAGRRLAMPAAFERNSSSRPSPLFGREQAVTEVIEALGTSALVSLVGPGGIGKTQLALEAASTLVASSRVVVRVISLASLVDSRFLTDVVASSLGVKPPGGDCSIARIAAMLSDQNLLIVLDNCEHLVRDAAVACEALIHARPGIRVIATSREPLRVADEFVYFVPTLAVPKPDDDGNAILESPAVQLFLSRAGGHQFSASLDDNTLSLVGTICRRLDGIPLALELAAARAASLGVAVLAAELHDRFRILTGGFRTAPLRQQTLKATLDWSYQLLGSVEQRVLRRLGAFIGDFSLDAATAVAGDSALSSDVLRDAVTGLTAKSLILTSADAPQKHYHLLETTRVYACQKLEESGEADLVLAQHARYFLGVFDGLLERRSEFDSASWVESVQFALDNARSALDWCFSSRGSLSLGISLAAVVIPGLYDMSSINECRQRSSQVLGLMNELSLTNEVAGMRLLAAFAASRSHTLGPLGETHVAWSDVLTLAVKAGNRDFEARALIGLWNSAQFGGEGRRALYFARRFMSVAGQQQSETLLVLAKRVVGVSLHFYGNQTSARTYLQQMLSQYDYDKHQWRTIGFRVDHRIAAQATYARVLWLQGHLEDAKTVAGSALEAARESGHELVLCYVLTEAVVPLNLFLNEREEAQTNLAALRGICARHDLSVWSASSGCLELHFASQTNVSTSLIAQFRNAINDLQALGFGCHVSFHAAQLALALGRAGLPDEARETLQAAIARCENKHDLWYFSELQRIQGEFQRIAGQPQEAGATFEAALARAREQGAKALELRIVVSLAKLWRDEGKTASALNLLDVTLAAFNDLASARFDDYAHACALRDDLAAHVEALSRQAETPGLMRRSGRHSMVMRRHWQPAGVHREEILPCEDGIGARLGKAFSLMNPPTLTASTSGRHRLEVTELWCDHTDFGFSGDIPPEDSFLIGLQLRAVQYHELWMDGRSVPVKPITPGTSHIYDLTQRPVAYLTEPFHPMFFYIPRAALVELSEELGVRSMGDLRHRDGEFVADPVIYSLGQSLLPALHAGRDTNQLFVDHVLLALRTHLVLNYGGVRVMKAEGRGGLAPWQERAAKELMDAKHVEGVELAVLADACDLLPTDFVRAFKKSTGLSPNQWLQTQRVRRAITLLQDGQLSLGGVAMKAGFADQRHFTRAFTRRVGVSPDAYRRVLSQRT